MVCLGVVPIEGEVRPLEALFTGIDDVQSLVVVHLPFDLFGLLRRVVS